VCFTDSVFAQSTPVDPAQTISVIQNYITPVVTWATNWGVTAGFGCLGVSLFYTVVIIIARPDK